MNMPGFNAEQSLHAGRGRYRSGRRVTNGSGGNVIPAIPRCANCDYILDNCERNGWKPRAACAAGHCDSSQENSGGYCYYDHILNRRICDL
jgi:hypothetical protein